MNPQLILFMKIYYGAIEGFHCYNEQPDNTNPSQIIYRQPYNPSLFTQLKSIEQQNRLAYETFVEIHRTNPQLIHTYISNPFYNIYRESKYTALTLYQHYVCFFIKIYNESIKIIQFIYQNYEQLFFQPTNNLSQQSLYGVGLQLNHEFIDTYEQQYHTDLRKQELSQIKVFSVSNTQLSCLLKSLIYAYFDLFNLYYYYPQILFTEELMENPWLKEYLFKFIASHLNLTAPKYSILVSYIYQSIVEQEFNTVEELIYYCIAIIYSSDIQKHIKTLSTLATFEENKLDVDIFYTYVSEIRYLLNYTYVSLHKMVFFNLNRSKLTCFLWFLCSCQNNQNLFYEPENIKTLKKTFMEVYSKVYTIVQTYDGFTNDLKKENK